MKKPRIPRTVTTCIKRSSYTQGHIRIEFLLCKCQRAKEIDTYVAVCSYTQLRSYRKTAYLYPNNKSLFHLFLNKKALLVRKYFQVESERLLFIQVVNVLYKKWRYFPNYEKLDTLWTFIQAKCLYCTFTNLRDICSIYKAEIQPCNFAYQCVIISNECEYMM